MKGQGRLPSWVVVRRSQRDGAALSECTRSGRRNHAAGPIRHGLNLPERAYNLLAEHHVQQASIPLVINRRRKDMA